MACRQLNHLSFLFVRRTIYVEEQLRPLQYRIKKYSYSAKEILLTADFSYVHIDNIGVVVAWPSVVMEESTFDYSFDELEVTQLARAVSFWFNSLFQVTGYARLVFYHPDEVSNVTIRVDEFRGDRTGMLIVFTSSACFPYF